jgi:formylglycine-generating enzyme required for sulfatase activity
LSNASTPSVADAQRQLEQYSELADLVRVRDSLSSAKELWPAITRTIAPMETWLLRARRLTARRVGHEARLRALLSSETSPASGGTRERTQRRWHRQQLEELLRRLAKLETTTQGVSERLAQARSSWQRNAAYARLWKETRARIADVARSPRYRALELDPIEGLAPLGCDPDSSLEEFALIDTGALPRRDARGHLTLESGSAAVLVLLPAGRYAIGSHDDDGKENEHPRHEVTIRRPFMLGKHEVTQGQWLRLMGINPSQQPEGLPTDARELYPVDSVSWNRATEFARRLGCGLPSEAQWEYACRAGTATRWWTGDELSSLRGRVNLADRSHSQEPEEGTTEAWADGFATSAPVSSYEPNAFGLHELAGNLWEWCEDEYSERHDRTHSDERPRRTGDGRYVTSNGAWRWTPRAAPQTHTSGATERVASSEAASRYHVTRGGSWDDAGYELRSANRLSGNSTGGFDDDGLRLFRALD